ncbi:MAG TPA: hypothetical protein VH331_05920 [Allosphingosinicella sp.]|jgi:hypothetical protein|nr:hypothetical protein [Allosphingosinicella sp.]
MDVTVRNWLMPQMSNLLDRMLREGRGMRLDGVPVFEAHDQFLPGKIAGALALLLLETPRSDPNFERYVAGFRRISDMTVDDENHSWGIYYYVSALYRLKQAGLLERAVSPETLAKLRIKLDWRLFVRRDFTLIDLPNNYYGVAFSIARLRMLLGWEDASGSNKLFARMIDHYRRYSGAYGFADETDGEGRFDRYSVLLIGEIAQRLIETGTPAPPEVKQALRRSVDLMLLRFNMRGEGWEYGRSIGPYGETCFLEVMTAAAKLGLLNAREQAMAYAFSARIAARYMDFWVDPATGSVNMWDGGRRTDDYRSKNRILGENLSLARQYIYTNEEWNELGFRDRAPDPGYADWLARLPKSTLTWFARERFDRALLTVRDGSHVIGLPLVNGAESQHMHNPYFPIPFSPGMLSGAPDATWPQLVPRVTLEDGTVLMPLAWFRDVRVTRHGDTTILTYRQDLVDRMGGPAPVQDGRLQVATRYEFSHGRITRSDVLTPVHPLAVKALDLVFASFSTGARQAAPGEVRFAEGEVGRFEAQGFHSCAAAPVDAAPYRAPSGPFRSLVTCASGPFSLSRPVSLSWTISYR